MERPVKKPGAEPRPEIPKAPPGWKTNGAVADLLERDNKTVKKTAERYRSTHGAWFQEYLDAGGHPIEHYAPELVEQLRQDLTKIEPAPPGWKTINQLTKILGRDATIIKNTAKKFRSSHPDWFRPYLDPVKKPEEHLSPELIDLIPKKIEEIPPAPEGWKTAYRVAKDIGRDQKTAMKVANAFRTSHPNWFKEYRDTIGKPEEHFSPELIAKIQEELLSVKPAPEGWKTRKIIAKDLGRDHELVKKIGEQYRFSHPDWFRQYLDLSRHRLEHYSPELIAKIREELLSVKPAPEGWKTNKALAKQLGKSFYTVKRATDRYRTDHENWFKEYLNSTGKKAEHYSPELIAEIKKQLQK